MDGCHGRGNRDGTGNRTTAWEGKFRVVKGEERGMEGERYSQTVEWNRMEG